MAATSPGSNARRRTRDYPPLAAAGLVALLILAILPSSLNLPQSAPTEQLEFAPVPPEDDITTPPAGNFSSLSLAGGSSLGSEFDPELQPAAGGEVGGGRAKNPATKRCVGNPPRQAEDPLSPPCAAYFNGDNHGATYQGVTNDEVRVLFYVNCCINYIAGENGNEETPENTYVDLAEPPQEGEHGWVRGLRTYQRYFNERYQTYGRFVHFFIYFATSGEGPEPRRAEAVENFQRIKPFAVATYVSDNAEAYLEVMQRRGVIAFGGTSGDTGVFVGRSSAYFSRKPGLVWGYLASLEQYGGMYSSLVCKKLVPYPASFSGNSGQNGQPRRFGLFWADDPEFPFLRAMRDLVKQEVERCGGNIVAEATFPEGCCATGSTQNPDAGAAAMAAFVQAGVTTVLWTGGMEVNMSAQAGAANFRPEWLVLGDGLHDSVEHGQLMDQSVWEHAWVVTPKTLKGSEEEEPCFQAAREGDPGASRETVTRFTCGFYNDTRQMFTGIQVAGPRLDPGTMNRGFHAIPRHESSSPLVPACYYNAGDYTCVKDAMAQKWDPAGTGSSGTGCWKPAMQGRRFTAQGWPSGDLGMFSSSDDPCNTA
ncbi:MAG TPA: hypothetical protein VMY88_09885 [Acidimicrobiales bacterium]|nr:hypothetical protein [Acidimicrobiales bacterium]